MLTEIYIYKYNYTYECIGFSFFFCYWLITLTSELRATEDINRKIYFLCLVNLLDLASHAFTKSNLIYLYIFAWFNYIYWDIYIYLLDLIIFIYTWLICVCVCVYIYIYIYNRIIKLEVNMTVWKCRNIKKQRSSLFP